MTAALADGVKVEVLDCGDSAVRVGVQADDQSAAWRAAHGIARILDADALEGARGCLPTYDAVLVEFDCTRTDHASIRAAVLDAIGRLDSLVPRTPRAFRIPVSYGGERGPDLERTAVHLGITPDDVVAIHTAHPLVMRCFGSPAGAPMLEGPDFASPIPRLASPRASVHAGAVAVAGRQAVISARPAPGGWYVLGTTPVVLVDSSHEPLSPYWPGDTFSFFPIAADDFDAYRGALS
jgi:KipI family sensor histidine kinase inhibitor